MGEGEEEQKRERETMKRWVKERRASITTHVYVHVFVLCEVCLCFGPCEVTMLLR